MQGADEVRYDQVWRRIRTDSFASKFEGKFPERFRRLETLNNWGVLGWLYPHATATKQAHHLGVERNAMEFISAEESRERHEASFRSAAHMLHWGHLPLSYAGAEALFRAAQVDSTVQKLLDDIVNEVLAFGNLECDDPDHVSGCARRVRHGETFSELYKWLTAWIVSENWPSIWGAIRSASAQSDLDKDAVKTKLIRTLVCREDPGYKLLGRCNLADYVLRDLLQCGTAWLTVDIEAIWETNPLSPTDAASEWTLLDAARQYLDDRFYSAPASLLTHALAARAIAQGLLSQGLRRSDLRDLLTAPTGDAAYSRLPDYHRKRLDQVRVSASRQRLAAEWWHVGSFRGTSLPSGGRLAAEASLTRRDGTGQLSYPFTAHYSVVVETEEWWDPSRSLAGDSREYGTVHLHHRRRNAGQNRAGPSLNIAAQVNDWLGPRAAHQAGDGVLSWLLGGRVEQRASALYQVAGDLVDGDRDYFSSRLRKLRKQRSVKALNEHEIVALWADMIADGAGFPTSFIGQFVLRLPWQALRTSAGQEMLGRLRDRALVQAVDQNDPLRGHALEVAVAADQLRSPQTQAISHRFIILGGTLLSDVDGRPGVEWDTIRFDLARDQKWSVTAVECSVKRTSSKDSDDRDRLEYVRGAIQSQWTDLTAYHTLLATTPTGVIEYEDGARGFVA